MSRRQFIKTSAVLAAGGLFYPHLVSAAASASVRASSRRKLQNIAIQLYTVRKEMLADPAGTLKQLAAIGFKELESARSDKGNYYGLAPKEMRKITQDL